MRIAATIAALVVAFLMLPAAAAAQEDQAIISVTTRATLLSDTPKSGAHTTPLKQGAVVTVLKNERSGNLVYAGLPDGTEGWIPAADVIPRSRAPGANAPGTPGATPKSCPKTLAACSLEGCSSNPDHPSDPGLNRVKNAPFPKKIPAATPLTWNAIGELQKFVDQSHLPTGFSTALTPAQRKRLQKISTSAGPLSEGSVVSVEGFISLPANPTTGNPHPGGPESCNCGLSGATNIDYHINVSKDKTSDEFHGIVAEITPRLRLHQYSLARITQLEHQRTHVRITGRLLLDNVHKPRPDASAPSGGNPARVSIWEIHPVSAITVLP